MWISVGAFVVVVVVTLVFVVIVAVIEAIVVTVAIVVVVVVVVVVAELVILVDATLWTSWRMLWLLVGDIRSRIRYILVIILELLTIYLSLGLQC